jgi:hypothetical protein
MCHHCLTVCLAAAILLSLPSPPPLSLTELLKKKKKIYLFHVYEYTVAVFRQIRRGHQIPLQILVRHHVVLGN